MIRALGVRLRSHFDEQPLQNIHGAVHFFFRHDVRRQETEHGVVCAIEQQPFLNSIKHNLLARHGQLHPHHESEAAHFLNEGELACKIVQLSVEVAAYPLDGRQEFIEDIEKFESHTARQRTASESTA